MKKVNNILTHLKYNPDFKKLSTNIALEKLINALPAKLSKGVKFAYIKKQILFFVLTHPVYKMEFEYNKTLIKALLKTASIENIDDVKFFVTNRIEKKVKQKIPDQPSFKERSYGIFENSCKNEKLNKLFEEIRNIIKSS